MGEMMGGALIFHLSAGMSASSGELSAGGSRVLPCHVPQ